MAHQETHACQCNLKALQAALVKQQFAAADSILPVTQHVRSAVRSCLYHALLLQAFYLAQHQMQTSVAQLECNRGFLSEMFSAYHDHKKHGNTGELLRKVGLSIAACIDLPVGLTEA